MKAFVYAVLMLLLVFVKASGFNKTSSITDSSKTVFNRHAVLFQIDKNSSLDNFQGTFF